MDTALYKTLQPMSNAQSTIPAPIKAALTLLGKQEKSGVKSDVKSDVEFGWYPLPALDPNEFRRVTGWHLDGDTTKGSFQDLIESAAARQYMRNHGGITNVNPDLLTRKRVIARCYLPKILNYMLLGGGQRIVYNNRFNKAHAESLNKLLAHYSTLDGFRVHDGSRTRDSPGQQKFYGEQLVAFVQRGTVFKYTKGISSVGEKWGELWGATTTQFWEAIKKEVERVKGLAATAEEAEEEVTAGEEDGGAGLDDIGKMTDCLPGRLR